MSPPPRTAWDVVVLGAGAAGLLCAAACGRRGRSVLVVDHGPQPGAKLRITGGGRCNFTNLGAGPAHYRSQNPRFCASALARFTPADAVALLDRHGVAHVEREDGQLFCAGSAREVVALLERECRAAGVTLRLGCRVSEVRRGARFALRAGSETILAQSLVVATGGLSYPTLGASGFGLDLARRFGLPVVGTRPALAPFVFAEPERSFFRDLAGVSLRAAVTAGGRSYDGSILFTHRGLSGPAALQASLRWDPGEPLEIDLAPGADLLGALLARRGGPAALRSVLAGHLPRRLAAAWCAREGIDVPVRSLADGALRDVAARIHRWRVTPGGTEGYRTAEATAGGVDTTALSSKTLEARAVPGLYFIGEVVDVTGEVGGYNLQWAWSSGHAAGQFA